MSREEQKGAGILLKPQKIILVVLALVILGAVALIIFTQYDPTVAVVNGEKIKRSELYELMYMQVRRRYTRRYHRGAADPARGEEARRCRDR